MIKMSNHQQDITIIIIYVPSIGFPKYIKQMVKHLKGEVDYNIIIVGTQYPLSIMERQYRHKIKTLNFKISLGQWV
jgi:hypothetical protein